MSFVYKKLFKGIVVVLIIAFSINFLGAQKTSAQSPSPSGTASPSPSDSSSPTPTPTPSDTGSPTGTGSPSPTPTPTQSAPPPPATSGPLYGWAWSSTIGWISFNSANSTSGGGSYSVGLDASGNLTGYAWSSNIGWVKFGGLSGFPSNGASGVNAQVANASTTGSVTGWARACAGSLTGSCSSPASRSDGWDGWIEMSGTNHTLTYTYNNTDPSTITGYAWGGDVVGWLEFFLTTNPNQQEAHTVIITVDNSPNPPKTTPSDACYDNGAVSTTYSISGAPAGATYYYQVDSGAVTSIGTSVSSTTPITKTITWTSAGTKTVKFSYKTSAGAVSDVFSTTTTVGTCPPAVTPADLTLTVDPQGRYPVVSNSLNIMKTAKVRRGKPFSLTGTVVVSNFDARTLQLLLDDPNPDPNFDPNVVSGAQQIIQNTPFVIYELRGEQSGQVVRTSIQVQALDPSLEEK